MSTNRKMLMEFFRTHTVFTLEDATRWLSPTRGRTGAVEKLRYHLKTGRLIRVTREVYATVPMDATTDTFAPDPFAVAAAIRPDGVFSYHSALELLGVAHTAWNQCTLHTARRRKPLRLDNGCIRFLLDPEPLNDAESRLAGTRRAERGGHVFTVTGPERTLVEGLRRPGLAGGIEELAVSAGGFPVLDLDLLRTILTHYAMDNLWAATGWFLERNKQQFHVPDEYLDEMEHHRPANVQYLLRGQRGGRLQPRWNLILPEVLVRKDEAGEP